MNPVIKPKIKGVMSIKMLKLLIKNLEVIPNYLAYEAVMFMGFWDSSDWYHWCPLLLQNLTPLDSNRYVILYLQ